MLPARPKHLGPYELLEPLGQGAMGSVFKARHRELGAVRAVKVLTSRRSQTSEERFLREARHLASLRHPGVVAVHESGVQEGWYFYAMDLVEGDPLDEVLARGRLPLERALDLSVALCRGVDALHAEGIVHRDLKPANVVLDRAGQPVVLDLGVAVAPDSDERLTRTGAMVGTPLYMSPEQARGERASIRSDVYSLGLVIHSLLSGYEVELSGAIPGYLEPPPPSRVDPDLPRSVDAVLGRALAVAPEERHSRAGELGDALAAVAQAPGLSRRALRRLFALATVSLLVLLGVALGALLPRLAPPEPEAEAPPRQPAHARDTPRDELPSHDPKAARELRKLARLEPPAVRHRELATWLDRHGDDASASEARALLADARRRFPLATLFDIERAELLGARVAFQGPNRALTSRAGGSLWSVALSPPHPAEAIIAERGRRLVAMALSPNGELLAVSRERTGVELIRLPDGQRRTLFSMPVQSFAFSPDGELLATGGGYREIRIRNLRTDEVRQFGPYLGSVVDLAFSPDGRYLAAAASDFDGKQNQGGDALDLWDLERGDAAYHASLMSDGQCVAWAPDGETFFVGRSDGRLQAMGLNDREVLRWFDGGHDTGAAASPRAHHKMVRAVCFLPSGYLLSAGNAEGGRGQLRLWDPETGDLVTTIATPGRVLDMALSPDGERLLLATHQGVTLWDAAWPKR